MDAERFFLGLAAETAANLRDGRAPARLKARIYSRLTAHQASTGPLLSLRATKAAGRALCVFESALEAIPVGERVKSANPCRACHARYLAEHLDPAPIYWPHCPYTDFQRR